MRPAMSAGRTRARSPWHTPICRKTSRSGIGCLHPADRASAWRPESRNGGNMWRARIGGSGWSGQLSRQQRTITQRVHVAYEDARPMRAGAARDLPTEAQWESPRGVAATARTIGRAPLTTMASRSRTHGKVFSRCDTKDDGYVGTAPVGCFQAQRLWPPRHDWNVWNGPATGIGRDTHASDGQSTAPNWYRSDFRRPARKPRDQGGSHIMCGLIC